MYRYVLIAAACAVALVVRRRSFVPGARLALVSAACAVLMLVSTFCALTALQTGDLTLVIPITQASFLFTSLFSFLFLKERLDWGKVAGLAAAVAGLIVIR
jgi:drug/metabolite transporter (DMT)-like permease